MLLNRLLAEFRPLIAKTATAEPDTVERSAMACELHSFYTGIENIFKQVASECDGSLPSGQRWHRDLLDCVARPGRNRPAVISMPLRESLGTYLDFRHVFRQAYTLDLQWGKMRPLVAGIDDTLRRLEAELEQFLKSIGQ